MPPDRRRHPERFQKPACLGTVPVRAHCRCVQRDAPPFHISWAALRAVIDCDLAPDTPMEVLPPCRVCKEKPVVRFEDWQAAYQRRRVG